MNLKRTSKKRKDNKLFFPLSSKIVPSSLYSKTFMGTVLIGLSLNVYMSTPVSAAQTKAVSSATSEKHTYTEDEAIEVTNSYRDLNGQSLLPDQITYNQIQYPPEIDHYWIVPDQTIWTTSDGIDLKLSVFLHLVDPKKGDPLNQVIGFINAGLEDNRRKDKARISYVYEPDQSQFEGNTLNVAVGAKIEIPTLVRQLKNVDGTDGDRTKVGLAENTVIDTSREGTYKIGLIYYDQMYLKQMMTTATVHVTSDKTSLVGKNPHLSVGETWTIHDLVEKVTKSDGTSGNIDEVQITGTIDTKRPGSYPVTLTYTDPTTAKQVTATATVTVTEVPTPAPVRTIVTRFIDGRTHQSLADEILRESSSDQLPDIPLPVEILGKQPSVELSTYEEDGVSRSIATYMTQQKISRQSYWADVVQSIKSQGLSTNTRQKIILDYVYLPDESMLKTRDLTVHMKDSVNKEQLILKAKDSIGQSVEPPSVSVNTGSQTIKDRYLVDKIGDIKLTYLFHDTSSLHDITASSTVHVLPTEKAIEHSKSMDNHEIKKRPIPENVTEQKQASQTSSNVSNEKSEERTPSTTVTIVDRAKESPTEEQPETKKREDDQKQKRKRKNEQASSLSEHQQVTQPVSGSPAPGGGTPAVSELGSFMRGIAGTFLYSDRSEFDRDEWL